MRPARPAAGFVTADGGERAAVTAGAVTVVAGIALLAFPHASGPAIGLVDHRYARAVGLVDLVVAAGLLAGRPRWPWLAARAALNLPTAALALQQTRHTDRITNGRVFAAALSVATVGDALFIRAMRRG